MFPKSSLHRVNKMRTKKQQNRSFKMTTFRTLKSIVSRSQDTLLQDSIGAAALIVMLVVGLHLPAFV
ncbi:MAG: hypothetical protein ACJAVM_000291 [Sulfitobacter sp.]|jgi:hypothetical protein